MLTTADIDAIPTAFPVTVVAPKTAAFEPIRDAIEDDNAIERMGRAASTLISFNRLALRQMLEEQHEPDELGLEDRTITVPVAVDECGDARAYYDPGKRQIRLCYEFIELSAQLTGSPIDRFNDDLFYVLEFTILHEIGHALVDLLGLRIDPRENELRADQFAMLVLTTIDNSKLVNSIMRATTKFFVEFAEIEDPDAVHGSNKDRATFAICIVWRRHRPPRLEPNMAGDLGHSCDAYADEAMETWNTWLAPYTRLEDGKTFNERKNVRMR